MRGAPVSGYPSSAGASGGIRLRRVLEQLGHPYVECLPLNRANSRPLNGLSLNLSPQNKSKRARACVSVCGVNVLPSIQFRGRKQADGQTDGWTIGRKISKTMRMLA